VSFNSAEGRKLFKESLAEGSAEAFLQLSGNLAHQSEPAFCALGSLAIVLNALEVDPQKPWKGVWRWYDETVLDCSPPLEEVRRRGLTFGEFACLARCNGLDVIARQGSEVSKETFVRDIREVCEGTGSVQMVVSFSRKSLGQTGDGHFSPVGAYHRGADKVLVLDVARFKYPSYFVSTDMLYESMKPIDKETGVSRGYFLLRKGR
ncbi:Phytochelatin synthase, partial [Zopfochytrium polystomum]